MKSQIALLLTISAAAAAADQGKVTLLRDVAPILNKVGCSFGTCHGARVEQVSRPVPESSK